MKQYIEPTTEVFYAETEGALCMSIIDEEAGPIGAPRNTIITTDDSDLNVE